MNEKVSAGTEWTAVAANENSYDQLPYPSHCFPQTHPDRLFTVARLFGVAAPHPEQARVLEIGCASGGNLIPMAEQMPDAEFLGIDLSQTQINEGCELVQASELQNIRLRQQDVLEIDESIGQFDYIICHGVYSWVPPQVQHKILETFHNALKKNGIGYVSFNTFPGWHLRGMIRDMMCYHVQSLESAEQRVSQARALLSFLAQSVNKENSAYGMLLHQELEILRRQSDSYLFHEHLERFNQPIYFHEFVETIGKHSLQYLGDASVSSMWIGNFPQDIAATLQKIAPDIHQREQYTDFLRNRTFRQALVVHQDVTVDRNLTPERISEALVCGQFSGIENQSVDLNPTVSISFQEPKSKRKITSANPVFKAAVVHLSNQWPNAIPVQELFEISRNSLNVSLIENAEQVESQLTDFKNQIIQLFVAGLVQLKFTPDRFTREIPDCPTVSKLTRLQAASGRVANRRHEQLEVNHFTACVCSMADGSCSRTKMLSKIRKQVKEGNLVVKVAGQPAMDVQDDQLETFLAQSLDRAYAWLSKNALLMQSN